MSAKNYIWACPLCEDALRAPSRLRSDDVRGYCLTCSKETGKLVKRVCPVLDRKRAARAEREKAKRKRAYERTRPQRERDAKVRAFNRRQQAAKRRDQKTEAARLAKLLVKTDKSAEELQALGYIPVGRSETWRHLGVTTLLDGTRHEWAPRWVHVLLTWLPSPHDKAVIRHVLLKKSLQAALHALAVGFDDATVVRYALDNYPFPLPDDVRNTAREPAP